MADIIQATSSGVKDMADGSLRITFEFEPSKAKEAYALFGSRGTQCAIAALNLSATLEQAQNETIESDKPKGGLISQWLALRCKEPEFWRFLEHKFSINKGWIATDFAADLEVKERLEIESKVQLDHDKEAEARFHDMIRLPYAKWLASVR